MTGSFWSCPQLWDLQCEDLVSSCQTSGLIISAQIHFVKPSSLQEEISVELTVCWTDKTCVAEKSIWEIIFALCPLLIFVIEMI